MLDVTEALPKRVRPVVEAKLEYENPCRLGVFDGVWVVVGVGVCVFVGVTVVVGVFVGV